MSLIELLERERRSVTRLLGASGATTVAAAVTFALAFGMLLLGGARWLTLPRVMPFVLWLAMGALVLWCVRLVRSRLEREATLSGIARHVERERALRDGALRGTVEVAESGALGRLGAEQMAKHLEGYRETTLVPSLHRRMLRHSAMGAAALVAGVVVFVSGLIAAPDGWAALRHPIRAWRGALLNGVQLEPIPNAVLRGERLSVTVLAPGRREVVVAQRRTGSSWRSTPVAVNDGRATLELEPIDADLTLFATDGRAHSDTATVKVVERPFIGDVVVRARFPAYLGRQEEIVPLGEPARVPRGTELTFDGQSSTELQEVHLARGEQVVALTAAGRRFSGQLVASVSGSFEWRAVGRNGPVADVPPPLELEVLPDSAPQVEIVSPAADTSVSKGDTVALQVLATDDHGLRSIDIRSWIVTGAGQNRPATARTSDAEGQAHWAGQLPITTNALEPGDELHIVAAATDASPWHLTGESRALVLRLPTLSEQRDAFRTAADSTVARAEAAAAAQRQLQQRTTNASRQRDQAAQSGGRGQSSMSYESSEQAKALAREQRQLTDRMEQLQDAARQLEEQLRQAGGLDSALQERLREAQQLLQQALTPELAEQLRKLEEASQSLSQQDARQALTDLAEQQRRLREQLEKSVEMLKRAALEGSMSTLKDEARELADLERRLADSIGRANDERTRSEAGREARELADRSRNLSEDVKELQQRLTQEKAEAGAERVAEAERRMQESVRNMEQAARSEAGERQNQGQQRGQQQGAQQQGAQQQGAQQQGAQQQGQQQGARQQNAQRQQGGRQQGAGQQQQQGNQQQAGQQQQGGRQQQAGQQQQGSQQRGGEQNAAGQEQGQRDGQQGDRESAARRAADAMENAAEQLAQAREQQVSEWKKELSSELDRSIQEMIQLAREQDALEQKARTGTPPADLRPQQSALQQGVEKSAQRLQEAGQRSSLLSQRSLRTVADARRRVEDATRSTQTSNNPNQIAGAMREASEALNSAAASLVRDRERTETANSASGFEEMMQQLQQMAQQQAGLNSAVQQLLPGAGQRLDASGQQQSRQLGRQQRDVAAQLDDMADRDNSGRADELAREARQIAQALEAAQLDPSVLDRQQRLFRKMLDAGRLLEEEEREDTGKREAKPWTGTEVFSPQATSAGGRAASRFQPPTWNELRGLTPEERRLVLEYFKKINGERP